jgi:hypothetical protein
LDKFGESNEDHVIREDLGKRMKEKYGDLFKEY